MADDFEVTLTCAERPLYRGKALQVEVPEIEGYRTFLPHHSPLITLLQEGKVRIVDTDEKTYTFKVSDGVASCSPHNLIVAVTTGEPIENEPADSKK